MRSDDFSIQQVAFFVSEVKPFLQILHDIAEQYNVTIVSLNRNAMAGRKHVISALSHAIRSFQEKNNIARTLEIEVLLYAAGTRQTSCTKPFGIQKGYNEAYLCIYPKNEDGKRALASHIQEKEDEDWDVIPEKKQQVLQDLFSIPDEELKTVGTDRIQELVCERVALLEVFK
ncbi:MAG: hypothetical protein JXA44_11530 [Methanospirillaceae archaeon]|nr:hypothetical protein [Methanospirillaceae archaeon]